MKPIAPIIIKKKKGGGHGGHHGGSWKVAYADFVTAMMAFFMVLWIMGLSDELRIEVQGYFNDPMGFMKNPPRSREVFSIKGVAPNLPGNKTGRGYTNPSSEILKAKVFNDKIDRTLKQFKDSPAQKLLKNVEIKLTSKGLLIEFVESDHVAFFDLGSSTVRPEAKKIFLQIGKILAQEKKQMMINGYTDARPYQNKEFDNWDLSGSRALSLKRILTQGGVNPEQIEGVKAMGPTQLKKPDDPFHSSNRRVTILLPFDNKVDIKQNLPGNLVKENMAQNNLRTVQPFHLPMQKKQAVKGYLLGAPIK